MKRKYETRYFVTDVASIPVVRVYGKTEMYRQAAKDGWGVVYRDETNTLVCDEDSSANFYTKNGGYYGLSGNDEVIAKEMPKQAECAAIVVSDSCGFSIWAEDFSQIHFFVTYDANGLVDSYRIEYGDGPIYDGEVEVSFEGLLEQPEGDWQESYRAEIPGTIEYQNKREADKLAEESGETWMDSKQREQFRRVCGKIDRIKSAWDFWVTMQSLEYDFDKKIINTARNYKKCYNFTQYEQPQEVARRDELMECYEKYALAAEDTTEAGAEAMHTQNLVVKAFLEFFHRLVGQMLGHAGAAQHLGDGGAHQLLDGVAALGGAAAGALKDPHMAGLHPGGKGVLELLGRGAFQLMPGGRQAWVDTAPLPRYQGLNPFAGIGCGLGGGGAIIAV